MEQTSSPKNKALLIIGVIVVLIIAGGAYAFVSQSGKKSSDQVSTKTTGTSQVDTLKDAQPLKCESTSEHQWYRTDDTLVIDPSNPNNLYVNVEWKGFHKSTDGGKTWQLKTKNIIVDHKDEATGKPCYGEYPVAVIDPTNPQRILLATSGGGAGTIKDLNMRGGGVYESTDGAETWKQKINDTMNGYVTHALVLDPKNPQKWYYGTSASPASYKEADPNKIWVTKGIIYKTADNGKTWEELPTGFSKNGRLSGIIVDPANSDKITAVSVAFDRSENGPNQLRSDQLGIIQSLDGGTSWKRVDNLPAGYQAGMQLAGSPKNGNNMYLIPVTSGDSKWKNFYSLDAGKTWSESTTTADLVEFDPFDATGQHLIGYKWQCTDGPCSNTLFESVDAGKTWKAFGTIPTDITNIMDPKSRISNIVWHPTDKNTIFMSGANAYVWKSADNGKTWETLLSLDKLPK